MRHTIAATCGACAIAGISVLAQTPSTQPPSSTPPAQAAQASSGSSITLTGCLKPWTGTAHQGSAASPADDKRSAHAGVKYMLSNIEGQAAAGTTPASYALHADASVDLAAHVNHKVAITGTIAPGAATSSAGAPPATTPAQPGAASPMSASDMTPSLKVTSVKMISATCP